MAFRYSCRSTTVIVATWSILLVCLLGTRGFEIRSSRPIRRYASTFEKIVDSTSRPSLRLNEAPSDSNSEDSLELERRNGILVLMTVPMAWGTFEPAVRYVYEIQPDIPPFVFSFVYYLIASTALGSLAMLPTHAKKHESQNLAEPKTASSGHLSSSTQHSLNSLLPVQGGLELGTYLFLGNALQVIGLKTVPSDRAAFLLQLTSIFVPIVQSILAKNLFAVPTKTWIACCVALAGVAFIGLDGGDQASSLSELSLDSVQFSIGDLYIALGAVFYTFHCIRLELYAKSTSAVKLAAAKASTETLWCALFVLTSIIVAKNDSDSTIPILDAVRSSGTNIMEYVESLAVSLRDETIASDEFSKLGVATAWTGLVPVAYTIYAQSFGQSRVAPATANLIYTIQPFFTALVAYIVLGESLGFSGYIGGLLIAAAVLLVIQSDSVKEQAKDFEV
jgi:drug/metabolite transporter (DMT)-like permease